MTVEFKQDEIVRLLRFFCIPSSQCLVVGMSKRFGAEERDEQFPPAGQAGHSFQKRVEWFFLSVSFPSCCRRRQERHGPLRLTYVAEGFRDGWRSFPIGCIRYTRTEPPLSFCENVDYARGAFRSRRDVFDAACAEVRDLMSRICDAAAASNAAAAGSEKNLIKKLTHLKKTRTSFVLFFGLERTSRREPPATPVLVRRPAQFRRRPRRAARTADATDAGYVIRGADGAGATSGCYRIFFFTFLRGDLYFLVGRNWNSSCSNNNSDNSNNNRPRWIPGSSATRRTGKRTRRRARRSRRHRRRCRRHR